MSAVPTLLIWRHPRPVGAAGRCIGRTDLPVPARRAKRLAHRIRRLARREGLAREVWSSPLRRCADVARWLRRWGWRHHVDPLLLELDFGRWDGLAWSRIDPAEVAAWEADFGAHAPGGGESLLQIRQRVSAHLAGLAAAGGPRLLVGHAGWINTLRLLERADLTPQDWPAAPAHGTLQRWPPESPGSRCG
ncbi:alpha-ribazole phosphatase [Sphaerotilus hippei]|uniref:Alpha-ribazole phosphatase n=1 Tax=Sphaerotilus hippei TaxID=744406 RepID=A0A318GV28_9BURK|nr:histidine phosphatase family protein [Sphaerotilus hippei]PXW93271.1 alpha-ribazole phosphatase [Sphaerotilus hippei]